MLVLVLSACPPGLRGYLTRWLLEISAGVFVGRVSRRVRELMWERTVEMTRTGRAIMVFSARNEQGMDFLVHGHHWEPVDVDGIKLMLRPAAGGSPARARGSASGGSGASRTPVTGGSGAGGSGSGRPATGWSKAAGRRRAR